MFPCSQGTLTNGEEFLTGYHPGSPAGGSKLRLSVWKKSTGSSSQLLSQDRLLSKHISQFWLSLYPEILEEARLTSCYHSMLQRASIWKRTTHLSTDLVVTFGAGVCGCNPGMPRSCLWSCGTITIRMTYHPQAQCRQHTETHSHLLWLWPACWSCSSSLKQALGLTQAWGSQVIFGPFRTKASNTYLFICGLWLLLHENKSWVIATETVGPTR